MTSTEWTVSAVIPTIGRPELRLAVESALRQTEHLLEVIVAADTDHELDLPDDSRVIVIRTGPRAGGNVARMAGIRAARGELIALLDDDDEWMPDKLARQILAVQSAGAHDVPWISSTLVLEPSGRAWPERRLVPGEPLPSYLFRKDRVKAGQGAMHTSTLLFPRSLAIEIPFDESLRFHQDIDWLIRVDRDATALRVTQVDAALTQLGEGGGSVSRGIAPERSLEWAHDALAHVDRRVRGDFLVTVTYFQACRHRRPGAALRVLRSAYTWGRPGVRTAPSVLVLPLKVLTGKGIA